MVYRIDPLSDERWTAFVAAHPDASVFHSRAWLAALQRTYGYQPLALTLAPPGETLRSALVFCRVNSWLTGKRLVSLPFSDHVEPLLSQTADLEPLRVAAEDAVAAEGLKYVEFRPLGPVPEPYFAGYTASSFTFHQLDLTPGLEVLHRNLHQDSIQRKIRRAEREGLEYSEGIGPRFVGAFCQLMLRTRRRHGLPPQPRSWFENLAASFGDHCKIRLASHHGEPMAAMLTLQFRSTMVYKYGCSDENHHNLGGMQLLMWRTIQESVQSGLSRLDLGRSDLDNPGLILYKDRWGASQCVLTYYKRMRSHGSRGAIHSSPVPQSSRGWKSRLASRAFTFTPSSLNTLAGRLFYRHLG